MPNEHKTAWVLTNETNQAGRTFTVVSDPEGNTVFSGTVGPNVGPYGKFSSLHELSFDGLKVRGKYRLCPGNSISPCFRIGERVYNRIIPHTLRLYRVQRCGDAGPDVHAPCHLKDGIARGGAEGGTHVDASGGWHDAGDYLKFLITSGASTLMMLTAFDRHPRVFGDNDGNHIPDVLDEARISLDWILKMWDPANDVLYFQVGSAWDHNHWRMPEDDDLNYPTRAVWASQEGRGANIAGKAAASLALAAAIWGDPTKSFCDLLLASSYLMAAKQIYGYGK